ncbi:hypothetical protein [Enterococcus sp. UD-01]|jgi:hypothetical protein|uniref:hypothetical protein n=1 Tax=Enterococcus sp. UD-01 TaxID=3373911 RepID=UPI0038370E50
MMKTNNKEKLMDLAVDILTDTNINELETVDVSETHYDDGSVGVSINLTYPAVKVEKNQLTTTVEIDGEAIAKKISDAISTDKIKRSAISNRM